MRPEPGSNTKRVSKMAKKARQLGRHLSPGQQTVFGSRYGPGDPAVFGLELENRVFFVIYYRKRSGRECGRIPKKPKIFRWVWDFRLIRMFNYF